MPLFPGRWQLAKQCNRRQSPGGSIYTLGLHSRVLQGRVLQGLPLYNKSTNLAEDDDSEFELWELTLIYNRVPAFTVPKARVRYLRRLWSTTVEVFSSCFKSAQNTWKVCFNQKKGKDMNSLTKSQYIFIINPTIHRYSLFPQLDCFIFSLMLCLRVQIMRQIGRGFA